MSELLTIATLICESNFANRYSLKLLVYLVLPVTFNRNDAFAYRICNRHLIITQSTLRILNSNKAGKEILINMAVTF